VPECITPEIADAENAEKVLQPLEWIQLDCEEVKDNLLFAQMVQAHQANKSWGNNDVFTIGDHVMLSMLHQQWEYHGNGEQHATKNFPRFDGLWQKCFKEAYAVGCWTEDVCCRIVMPWTVSVRFFGNPAKPETEP
jgi:hypothetical protein